MCYQLQLTPDAMSKLVYFSRHDGIRTVLKMFHEIQRIAQDYDNVHHTRGTKRTQLLQIWENMEKIGVPCKPREPYHHKIQQYNDLNYGKSDGSTSDKILIRHEGILKV